ncbi:MAG: hypothetical protein V3R63_05410 [Alphaproteobacteria bacterium]
MPDLDLGDLTGLDLTRPLPLSADRSSAALRLAAAMAWPDDEGRRREFVATRGAQAVQAAADTRLAVAVANFAPPPDAGSATQASQDAFPGAFHIDSDLAVDADAPGMDAVSELITENAPGWYVAGSVLYLVSTMAKYHRDLPGGPGVGKAITLLERFGSGPDMPKDRRGLRAAWRRFKPVAHLCAAFVSLITEIQREPVDRQDALAPGVFSAWLGVMLGVGREFQDFATSFKAPGQHAPLLVAAEIWTVPKSLTLPKTKVKTAPFSAGTLATFKDHRAP